MANWMSIVPKHSRTSCVAATTHLYLALWPRPSSSYRLTGLYGCDTLICLKPRTGISISATEHPSLRLLLISLSCSFVVFICSLWQVVQSQLLWLEDPHRLFRVLIDIVCEYVAPRRCQVDPMHWQLPYVTVTPGQQGRSSAIRGICMDRKQHQLVVMAPQQIWHLNLSAEVTTCTPMHSECLNNDPLLDCLFSDSTCEYTLARASPRRAIRRRLFHFRQDRCTVEYPSRQASRDRAVLAAT